MDTLMATAALTEHIVDIIAFAFVIALIAGYHVYLRSLSRRNPYAVLSSVAAINRTAWVETMMSDRSNGLLAVQTLRNSTMAATFLASTSILLMVGVLTLSGQGPALKTTWHYLNMTGTLSQELWMVKLLILLLLLFFAFFSFANAIRIFNHVGYMINVQESISTREGPVKSRLSPDQVASELNRGGLNYSLGTRAYYCLTPFVFWLFGPLYMVASALVLVLIMLPRVDKTPIRMQTP